MTRHGAPGTDRGPDPAQGPPDPAPGAQPRQVVYRCWTCKAALAVGAARWRCDCGGLLDLDYELAAGDLDATRSLPWSMWRYERAIPLPGGPARALSLSLGEGATPLVRGPRGLLCKLDFVMPTGSYKDRGAVVLVALAEQLGARRLVADSSGNAGVAIAAYAARAGIGCEVVVPASTSAAKVAQLASFGAEVVQVEGDRAAAASRALELVGRGGRLYASHVFNPFFFQGTKTIAYELAEQLGGELPDEVLVPAGNGTALIGLSIGFGELVAAGRAPRLPRLVAVQAARCAPLAAAFAARRALTAAGTSARAAARAPRPTLAEGIAIATPARLEQMLAAVASSGGEVVTVEEGEILAARSELAAAGLDVEPTAAATWAGLARLPEEVGAGPPGRGPAGPPRVGRVVLLTGSGLKSPARRAEAGLPSHLAEP